MNLMAYYAEGIIMGYELLTKSGYSMYEVASALQKACRRGDAKLAGFMAVELFPQYAEYCWRRLFVISAEDCAGPMTQEIEALYNAYKLINKNRRKGNLTGDIFIAKAAILLARVKHNRDADLLIEYCNNQKKAISEKEIAEALHDATLDKPDLPEYVYDVHTRQGKRAGKTKEDFFHEEQAALTNTTPSLFDGLNI